MKLPIFLALVATAAIASVTTYTLNQMNAKETLQAQPAASTTVQATPAQVNSTPTTEPTEPQADTDSVQFICRQGYDPVVQERVPTTYAWTSRGKISIIRWKSDWFANSGFTPELRCSEVSPRFESAYQNGNLNYLTNGRLNGEKAICAVGEQGADCAEGSLLLTLRPEDSELMVLNQLNSILNGDASGGPIEQSTAPKHSDGTNKVYLKLDIENFLATAPVEEE